MAPPDNSDRQRRLDREKALVAQAALDWVRNGMTLGLGSGTTSLHFIRALGERVRGGLSVEAVASSRQSEIAALDSGIAITSPRRGLRLDLTVDGADEIGPNLELIKGRGGALLREKVVVEAARYFLVLGDSTKRVERLGKTPVPVEVIPFALPWVADRIAALGGAPVQRMTSAAPGEPYSTDQRNYILDCTFGLMEDPHALARQLDPIPGVVGHGLFLDCTNAALVASGEGDDVAVVLPGKPAIPLAKFTVPY